MAEPPFLTRHRMQLKYWGGAIKALETFMLRVASLESVLASLMPVLQGDLLTEELGAGSVHSAIMYSRLASLKSVLASLMPMLQGDLLTEELAADSAYTLSIHSK